MTERNAYLGPAVLDHGLAWRLEGLYQLAGFREQLASDGIICGGVGLAQRLDGFYRGRNLVGVVWRNRDFKAGLQLRALSCLLVVAVACVFDGSISVGIMSVGIMSVGIMSIGDFVGSLGDSHLELSEEVEDKKS
jgi:hypothetical protein